MAADLVAPVKIIEVQNSRVGVTVHDKMAIAIGNCILVALRT